MSQSREVLLTTVNDILYLVRQVSAEALDVNTERLPHIVYEDLDFNANRDQEWILRNQDGKTIIVIDPSVAHEGVRSLLSDELPAAYAAGLL